MSRTIWKWRLLVTDVQVIDMPVGAEILTVMNQAGDLQLWAVVNQSMALAPRTIAIYGTGNYVPEDPGDYIASVEQGPFIWHVFEVVDR